MTTCNYYKTTDIVELKDGLLSLNADQARRRKLSLSITTDGLYEIEKPVQFKKGEEFGFIGTIPKSLTGLTKIDKKTTLSLKKSS